MADVNFQISVKEGKLSALFGRLSALVGKKMRDNFSDLRPLVKETVDQTIESNKRIFIPTAREAGELGVGEGGSISSKTQTAWLALKPSSGFNITTFSVRKKGAERGSIIGEIRISIDDESFFRLPDSNIDTESDALPTIPWMRWLIDGKTISGFSFRGKASPVSRTGRGIMVKRGGAGGMWDFNGRGREVFAKILDRARIDIGRRLRETRSVSVLRRRR